MSKRYFGTDGIRGRVGVYPMTPEFVLKLGWAVGRVLTSGRRNMVLIGKDTRISGYMLESALEAGLSAAGVNIHLLGPMPTPGIAYLTRTLRASAGIVISASHNLYYDNGLKFFSHDGLKLPDEVELAIEAALEQPMQIVESDRLGKAERVVDATGRYIEFCKSTIPAGTVLRGLKIVVDCAHGATYHVAPEVFEELGADVVPIGTEPNGLNINDACGAVSPKSLRIAVIDHQADVGVAIDGDGDRLIMVDSHGEVVDGDELLYIIANARHKEGKLGGGVVGTLMTNFGLEQVLASLGIPFKRAAVGDRYVLEMLQQAGWKLGGESSGHIICLDRTTTGDAIVSALQVLHVLVNTGRGLHEIKGGMTKYPQILVNVPIGVPIDIQASEIVQRAVADAQRELADRGRVLLRPSGTEPLVRVMVEGQDPSRVKQLAECIAEQVRAAANVGDLSRVAS
ncbi:MAG TPA: phosphoglucosamine mutase [Gammaproteobacteria bacterium]|jgi:phosphoglucosamine mutase|nr:phosphoglucosamine mutase [Pseudomonadota bacterium]HEX2237177.1 phosphoglucosamine mutase [Gammaproteobacteria bacterium]